MERCLLRNTNVDNDTLLAPFNINHIKRGDLNKKSFNIKMNLTHITCRVYPRSLRPEYASIFSSVQRSVFIDPRVTDIEGCVFICRYIFLQGREFALERKYIYNIDI